MSEILLQTLVEKVTEIDNRSKDTQEKIGQVPDYSKQIEQLNKQMEILQAEVWAIPAQISIPEAGIIELKQQLQQNTEQLKRPQEQIIRHVHHLRWPVITCFILGGVTLALVVFLSLAWDKIHENRASNIKYRDLRLWGTEPLQKILDGRDSAYLADPAGMEKLVTQEEQRRRQEQEVQERLKENEKEIRELEERKKASGVFSPSNKRSR